MNNRNHVTTNQMIIFCIPYFGKWPFWIRLFLESCKTNLCADFVIFADHHLPIEPPENVYYVPMRLAEFEKRVSQVLQMPITINDPHKVCDFRPFFAHIFPDYILQHKFWGYCDIDLVFGDLSRVLNHDNLDALDILTASNEHIVGHFTVLRNCEIMNNLAFQIDNYQDRARVFHSTHMDEEGMTSVLEKNPQIRFKYPESLEQQLKKTTDYIALGITFVLNGKIYESKETKFQVTIWRNGKAFLIDRDGKAIEVLYIHFQGLKRHFFYWNHYNPNINYFEFSFSEVGFSEKIFTPKDLNTPLRSLQKILILSMTQWRMFLGYLAQKTLGVSNARRFVLFFKKTFKVTI